MKLSFHTTVPASIEEVYEYVTAMGPGGPVDRVLFAQKYGEPVEKYDGDAVLTRDTDEAGDGEDTFWLCNFTYPTRRTMEAVESRWADREDVFEAVKGGTRWTVTFNPKTGGLQGLAQWLYFLAVGKYRIGVPVLSPVVHHFRRKARGEFDAADDSADEESRTKGPGARSRRPRRDNHEGCRYGVRVGERAVLCALGVQGFLLGVHSLFLMLWLACVRGAGASSIRLDSSLDGP